MQKFLEGVAIAVQLLPLGSFTFIALEKVLHAHFYNKKLNTLDLELCTFK
jgi:hypothetical protein